jgi:Thioredoxin
VGAVHVTYFTDPACPWSWAAEPAVRRLEVEFGETVSITYVMGGLAREFREPVKTMRQVLDAAGASAMPTDPRLWLDAPRIDLRSHAIVEAFGADIERPHQAARDGERHVPFPSFAVRGDDVVHWVYDTTDPAQLRAAALAAEWQVRAERALTGDIWSPPA